MQDSAAMAWMLRWLHTRVGRAVAQGLVVVMTIQGWPLAQLSRVSHWQSGPVVRVLQNLSALLFPPQFQA